MTDGKKKTVANWRTGAGGCTDAITCDATVPLPAIMFPPRKPGAPDIGPLAFRILTCLIWQAWEGIGTDTGRRHLISVDVLGEYAVVGTHAGTDYLRKGLGELVAAGFATTADVTPDVEGGPPLLLHLPEKLSLRSGTVEFSLTASGIDEFALRRPGAKFVRVWLRVLRHLPSMYAVRLYLLLARYANRDKNSFTVTPKKLADDLLIPADSSYRRNFAALEDGILRPTRDAIDFNSDMDVTYEAQRKSEGGPVKALTFMARLFADHPYPIRSMELVSQTLLRGPGRDGGPAGPMPLDVALMITRPHPGETFGGHRKRVQDALVRAAEAETAGGTDPSG